MLKTCSASTGSREARCSVDRCQGERIEVHEQNRRLVGNSAPAVRSSSWGTERLRVSRLEDSENPSFNLSLGAFMRRQNGMEEIGKTTLPIRIPHPGGYRIGVVLIWRPLFDGEVSPIQGRIHFRHDRTSVRHLPTVERPEVDAPLAARPQMP